MSLILYNKKEENYLLDERVKSAIQTRFRFAYKGNKLFCLVDFLSFSKRDVARVYLAKDRNNAPIIITADLQRQKAVVSGRSDRVIRALVKGSKMELEIPLDILDFKNIKTLYLNLARDYGDETTFWRGNIKSISEPMVYERFELQ